MAVTTVEVADHMLVASIAGRGGTAGADIQDTQITQHVSTAGANSAELTLTIHAVNLPGVETLQLILEQSNDQSNWFQVSPTTPPASSATSTTTSAPTMRSRCRGSPAPATRRSTSTAASTAP